MKHILALWHDMINQHRVVNPDVYLAANAELLFSTILMSLVITYLTNSEVLHNNAIRDMVGYNNPCVFWDFPPSLYFAAMFFSPMVYFAIRYAIMDTQRAYLTPELSPSWKKAIFVVNTWYAVSQIINGLIFVVTPTHGNLLHIRMHSAAFVQLVPALGSCLALNYLEGWASGVHMETKQWIALGVFITMSTLETLMASIAVFGWGGYLDGDVTRPSPPIFPPILMQCVDWGWFLSLPVATFFDPPAPGMCIDVKLECTTVGKTDEENAQLSEATSLAESP